MLTESYHDKNLVGQEGYSSTSNLESVTGQVKNKYDEIASNWREQVWVHDIDFRKKIVEFTNIGQINSLLDVGTGAGDLAALFDPNLVTGVDISKFMLDESKKIHPRNILVQGDAETLSFKDASFDVVCSRNLLQNFNNPTRAFGEMVRVLKRGGTLLVVESAVDETERDYPTKNLRVVEPFHPLFPSHQMLLNLFQNNGLQNVRQETTGVHKRFLEKWCLAKHATLEQKFEIYKQCKDSPDWYKAKYRMKFYPDDVEIEMTLPFSILVGQKI